MFFGRLRLYVPSTVCTSRSRRLACRGLRRVATPQFARPLGTDMGTDTRHSNRNVTTQGDLT